MSTPKRVPRGRSSCRRFNCFGIISLLISVKPVTLPPGRLMPELDRIAGCGEDKRNRGGQRFGRQRSHRKSRCNDDVDVPANHFGRRFNLPFATIQPPSEFDGQVASLDKTDFAQPLSEADSKLAPPAAVPPRRNPTTGTLRCCALAPLTGHAAATPPTRLINSRRLMVPPAQRTGKMKHSTWKGLAYVRFGSKADIRAAKNHVRFTPESGHSVVF
jgi:hypothetical protein